MKLVIAGSRHFIISSEFIRSLLFQFPIGRATRLKEKVTVIISGGATGVDTAAEDLATREKIPFSAIIPDWGLYGKSAGPRRNREMAELGDALLLVWDGESRGSFNMKEEMLKLGKPVYEIIMKESKNG